MSKVKIIAVLIVVAAAGAAVYFSSSSKDGSDFVTAKAERRDLRQVVAVTGVVQGAEEIDLNFEVPGMVKSILVKKGDEVEADQLLAELKADKEESAVSQARANLAAAQAQLDKLLAGPTPAELNVLEEKVKNAEINYQNRLADLAALQDKLSADQKFYQDRVESALVDFDNAKVNAKATTDNELFDGQSALNRVNDILTNEDAQDTLGAQNSSLLDQTKSSFAQAQLLLEQARLSLAEVNNNDDYDLLIAALDKSLSALTKISDTLSLLYDVLVNTPAGSRYTQAEIDLDKTNIRSDQATLSASITAVQNSKTAVQSAKSALQTAENNLAVFLANKDVQLSNAQGAVESAKGAWDLAKAELELKKTPARAEDIAWQRARVAQARAALAQAESRLRQTKIYAPISGVITKIHYEVGETVNSGRPAISLINKSGLEIEVDIPEVDITKVKVGDQAEITLDAYGEDKKFTGTVVFVDPAETVIQDVVYYKATLNFVDDISGVVIKPGMTANVDIITDLREGVVAIPSRAVREDDQGMYVQVLVDGAPQRRAVKVGLRGEQGLVEVIEGVNEGDEVITFINNNE